MDASKIALWLLVGLLPVAHELMAAPVVLTVRVVGPAPDAVELQDEQMSTSTTLATAAPAGAYEGQFPEHRPRPTDATLVAPYRLVASWGNVADDYFLGLRPSFRGPLAITVFHDPSLGFTFADLEQIDALGTDLNATLKKYTKARAFHRQWRYTKALPLHSVAVRSAKIWFDAAYDLAVRQNTQFRMDEEVAKIMRDYEQLAINDASFRRTLRSIVISGYVARVEGQIQALDWAAVAEVPRLIRDGRIDEADALNDQALASLKAQEAPVQLVVLRNQGISVATLEANSQYISALRSTQQIH